MRWIVFLLLVWSPLVFADTVLSLQGKVIELSALTQEVKAQVPTLEGLAQEGETVSFRKLSGEFTASEQATLQAVLIAHDATLSATVAQATWLQRQQSKNNLQILGLTKADVDALFP